MSGADNIQQDGLEYEMDDLKSQHIEVEELLPTKKNDTSLAHRPVSSLKSKDRGSKKVKTKRRIKGHGSLKKGGNAAMKYGSLVLLIAQMVGLVLLMRYSRTSGKKEGEGQLYLASTAVFLMEVMKFTICVGVVFQQGGYSIKFLVNELYGHLWNSPYEVLKLCVPSLLYTVQNNLLYCALTNLDAATYQVCYQLKILTTALFSAVLLKRKFSGVKWLSLVLLTVGVIIVQNSGTTDAHSQAAAKTGDQNRLLGLVCVLCAACTSGFAGVYFEKILKGSTTSLWIRNIQMGLPSVLIAFATIYVEDSAIVAEKGFFVGYSPIVWGVVAVQAIGGLIVAVVVKYADNVMKVFATSISIIVSCIISAVLFDFRPTFRFCVGAFLVMIATVMYGRPERKRKKDMILPMTKKRDSKKSLLM